MTHEQFKANKVYNYSNIKIVKNPKVSLNDKYLRMDKRACHFATLSLSAAHA
jgi:hypothetical protein